MMDAKTLEALKGSIAKWEAIVAGTGEDDGPKNCPLCQLFWINDCVGCPVSEKTGSENCNGSPYANAWTKTQPSPAVSWRADTPKRITAAQAELDFLKSLLPEGL